MDSLHAICVTTLDEALAYLQRVTSDREAACAAVNAAAAALEMLTGRKLAFRTYRDQIVESHTTTVNEKTLTPPVGGSAAVVGDWAVGANLRPGSVVVNADDMELNNAATATGTAAIGFGSAPLLMDVPAQEPGDPFQFYLPEYPLLNGDPIFEVYEVLDDGTTRVLSQSGMRIEYDTGLVILPQDSVARGSMNLEVHYSAGLRFPSATVLGHSDAYIAQLATHRLAQVNFQDWSGASGRSIDVSVGAVSRRSDSFRVPGDVAQMVESLKRRLM